jgi:hypothetical protein
MTRFLISILFAVGIGCAVDRTQSSSNQRMETVLVPRSWTRLAAAPDFGSPRGRCAGVLSMAWDVSAANNQLDGLPDTNFDERRDPLPYEIDFVGAIASVPPPPSSSSSGELPTRQNEWAVGFAREHARRIVLTVDDGWFVAFDAGEWGGSLWWYPRDRGPGRRLWDQNVRWLFRDGANLIALGGLAHLSVSEGVALRLSKPQGSPWAIVGQHALLGAPSAVTPDDTGRLVIVTTMSVERLRRDETEILARHEYLYWANSIVVAPGGAIAIGFPMFVHVLQPDGASYRQEWYVPPRCRTFEEREFECECTGPAGD